MATSNNRNAKTRGIAVKETLNDDLGAPDIFGIFEGCENLTIQERSSFLQQSVVLVCLQPIFVFGSLQLFELQDKHGGRSCGLKLEINEKTLGLIKD